MCPPDFQGPSCAEENECPADCSGRGLCRNRKCVCAPGYSGRSCSNRQATPGQALLASGAARAGSGEALQCPSNCWGRGLCAPGLRAGVQGVCVCDPDFGGEDCSLVVPCLDNCHGRGACANGRCFCDPGWAGANCSAPAGCANGCSAHGRCVHGTCFCDAGYQGGDCSIAPPKETKTELSAGLTTGISIACLALGCVVGFTLKVAADQRRRAQLIKLIQESDAQAPFVSGELQRAAF